MPTRRRLLTATVLVVAVAACGANQRPSPITTTAATAPATTAVAPPTTLSTKVELLAAYERSWEVYADALRRLDPSRLASAFAGSALRAAQQEVATQKANHQPVRIDVEHHPKVLLVTATDGVVADEGVNHSVVLDPATGTPTEPDPNERFKERRSFKLLDGSWKVVEIIEEHRQ